MNRYETKYKGNKEYECKRYRIALSIYCNKNKKFIFSFSTDNYINQNIYPTNIHVYKWSTDLPYQYIILTYKWYTDLVNQKNDTF